MKHTLQILLCLLLLAGSFEAQAQIGERRNSIALGVSGGIALNTIGFNPTIKQSMHIGETFGVVARFTSEKYFKTYCALQLEVNYTRLGWRENVLNAQSEPLPDTYRRDIHYLQFPLLARLGWGREYKGFMGYFLAGPQVGYCLGEKSQQSNFTLDAEGNPDRPNGMFEQYHMNVEKKFEYGITAGLGVELSTIAGRILLEGRYYYGLSDIFKNSKKDVFGRSNHNTIVAKITYLFDLKK